MSNNLPIRAQARQKYFIAAIPILIIILLLVIPARDEEEYVESSSLNYVSEPVVKTVVSSSTPKQAISNPTSWPIFDLDKVLACNPFEPPTVTESQSLSGEAAIESQLAKEEIASVETENQEAETRFQAVDLVYVSDEHRVAVVDNQIVHVGDHRGELEVIEIVPSGLVVRSIRK